MFQMPMSSPMMATMLGFLSCASAIFFSFFRLLTPKDPRIDSPRTISPFRLHFLLQGHYRLLSYGGSRIASSLQGNACNAGAV